MNSTEDGAFLAKQVVYILSVISQNFNNNLHFVYANAKTLQDNLLKTHDTHLHLKLYKRT